jgi:protein-tyrosine-phosphatase
MAAGFMAKLGGDRVVVRSAGSAPKESISLVVIEAMAEVGIDITQEFPKPLTDEVVRASDAVITMGCGDSCPIYPGKRYEDWVLDDPAGQGIDPVRTIRDEIKVRVENLISDLLPNH